MQNLEAGQLYEKYKIIKQLEKKFEPSAWTNSYLAEDADGKHIIVAFLDKDKIISNYHVNAGVARSDKEEEKEILEKAEEAYKKKAKQFVGTFEWCIDVKHPNIGEVYKLGFDEERKEHLVVKEFISGLPLSSATTGLTPIQMIPLFIPILNALFFLHDKKKVLHLNLKPARIRANMAEDGTYVVKLTDCGFARPIDEFEGNKALFGTPSYISYEVALRKHDQIGVKSDLQSLGIVMYYCITNTLPFLERKSAGKDTKKLAQIIQNEDLPLSPSAINKDCPEKLSTIIMNLLQKEPKDRTYNSAKEVVEALKQDFPEACLDKPVVDKTITVIELDNEDEDE